jgi:putative redox protein
MDMTITFPGGARVDARFGTHLIRTDQPAKGGGEDSAPTPFALFLASMGTCAGIYVLNFCKQRGIPTEGISLRQHVEKDPATNLVTRVEVSIEVPPEFPEKYHEALVRVAGQCTVKKHLEHPPVIDVRTVVAESIPAGV